MLGHRLRAIHVVVILGLLGADAQGVDAVGIERVVEEEAVLAGVLEHLLVAEVVEEIDQALGRDVGLVQRGRGRLVGRGFLDPRIGEGGQGGEVVGTVEQAAGGVGRSGHGGEDAQAHGQKIGGQGRLVGALARGVAAGDVAGFVGDDPQHLVGVLGRLEEAGVQEDRLPAHDEGVDLLVADQDDMDVVGVEPGRAPHRLALLVDPVLDLGVADDRDAGALGRGHAGRQEAGQEGKGGHGPKPALLTPPGP